MCAGGTRRNGNRCLPVRWFWSCRSLGVLKNSFHCLGILRLEERAVFAHMYIHEELSFNHPVNRGPPRAGKGETNTRIPPARGGRRWLNQGFNHQVVLSGKLQRQNPDLLLQKAPGQTLFCFFWLQEFSWWHCQRELFQDKAVSW